MSYIESNPQTVNIAYDDNNLYVTTTSTNTIPLDDIDLSAYYLGMQSNRSTGRPAISDITADYLINITETLDNIRIDNDGTYTTTYTPQTNTAYNVIAKYFNLYGNYYETSSQVQSFDVIDGQSSNITINDISPII